MIEEAIVHVGMHKTGSSSIQETLSQIPMHNVEYLSLGSANHSSFLATVLADNPEYYHSHARNSRSVEQVQALKESYTQRLHNALKTTNKSKILLSAEYLSRPNGGDDELAYLKQILLHYCKRIRVIGYVRPPVGYMQSAFQQRLKGGASLVFNLRNVYPNYYKRFAKVDAVFGEENVELVVFTKDSLYNGDVVQDFAQRIGADLTFNQTTRTNESLSQEATALMYALRRFIGEPTGYEGFSRDNNLLIATLTELGDQKLAFAESAVFPVLESNRKDLEWMSRRLGRSFIDSPSSSPHAIGSEEDLLNIAYQNRLAIWQLLQQTEPLTRDTLGIARLVDQLQILHALDMPPLHSPELTLFSPEQLQAIASSVNGPTEVLSTLAEALAKNGSSQLAVRAVNSAAQRALRLVTRFQKEGIDKCHAPLNSANERV